MEKKVFKYKSELFNQIGTFTLDEELNKHKGKVYAPKKLAEANRMLRNVKGPFPKDFGNSESNSQ